MNAKQEALIQSAIRLPKSFIVRLDKLAVSMSQPGMPVTRAEALRRAAFLGVETLESEKKKR